MYKTAIPITSNHSTATCACGKPLLLVLLALLFAASAGAVPAKPGQRRLLTLVDGSTVGALLVGDEHGHFWQGTDGKAYLPAGGQGRFRAADREALLERAAVRRAGVNARRMKRTPSRRSAGSTASIDGRRKGLVILANYSDTALQPANDAALYQRITSEKGFAQGRFKGSVHDYFYDQSGGKLEIEFDVAGPVTLSKEQSYYGRNNADGNDEHAAEMVIEALKMADALVDYADYDWDGDGEVELVYVIYAGMGEADGGAAESVWPQEYSLASASYYQGDGGGAQCLDGVKIDTFACGSELDGSGNTAGIGTMCHEFSHCLGYPDFYETANSDALGMAYWDLMDRGSYNGDGYLPAGYTSYERWMAGWETPTELTYTQAVGSMEALQHGGGSYIIYNKAHRDEYFLIENRQRVGWDAGLPGAGLLILHVDYDADIWAQNTVNSDPEHQRMTWIAADDDYQYDYFNGMKYYTFAGMASDTYPCGGNDSFGKDSSPAALLFHRNADGSYYLDSSLEAITQHDDGTIAFRFNGIETAVSDPDTKCFRLAADRSGLQSGLRCIIACGSKAKAAGTMSGSYLSPVDVTASGDVMTIGDDAEVFVAEETAGGWSFRNEKTGLYLYATAAKTLAYSSSAYYWTLSEGMTGLVMTYGDCGTMLYNATSPRFTTYTSSPTASMIQANLYVEQSSGPSLTEPEATGSHVYELVTDASSLATGDELLIACLQQGTAMAMGTNQKTANREAVSVVLNADATLTPGADAQVVTLEKDGSHFLFKVDGGYLYAASSSNQLKTGAKTDNARASVTIDGGLATITFQGTNSRNVVRYNPNSGSPFFACYASSSTVGSLPQLYRKVPDVSVNIGSSGYATLYYSDKNLLLPQQLEAYTICLDNGVLRQEAIEGIIGKGTAAVLKDTQADGTTTRSHTLAVVNTAGKAPAQNCLYGYDEPATTEVPGGEYKYYMLSLNAAGEPWSAGFYYGAPGGAPFTSGAHKAFLALPASLASHVVAYLLDGTTATDDTTTASSETVGRSPHDGQCYNLNGQRIRAKGAPSMHPAALVKGIYVIDGRKVMVK